MSVNGPVDAALNLVIGVASPIAAFLMSLTMDDVERGLRILSLLIGIAVGAVALVRQWRAKAPPSP